MASLIKIYFQVERLRDWGEKSDLILDTQVNVTNYDNFADMQAGKYYNILCQVITYNLIRQNPNYISIMISGDHFKISGFLYKT